MIAVTSGCTMQKQVQVRIVEVQLIKIEPIHRNPSRDEMLLTWKDEDNVEYVSFEPMDNHISIGSKMKMMVRR